MSNAAIQVSSVSKNFRLYHERNRYIKATLLRGRRARYEEFWALKDVSFEVQEGSTFGIIGSNGSGKSTMLKCLMGIYRPESGKIAVRGKIAGLLELGAGFHPELSGRENVFLNGAILGMSNKDITTQFDSIVEFAGLERFIDTPVKNFSSGMTVRLGFSIATHVEPEVLLIDEVLGVGDQAFQRKSSEKIEEFRRAGKTIIVVSHSLTTMRNICQEVIWLEKGTLKLRGPSADVIAAYTGESYSTHTERDANFRERWGTGEAHFNAIRLLNNDGVEIERINTLDSALIELTITPQTLLVAPIIKISIAKIDGETVWSTTSQSAQPPLRTLSEPCMMSVSLDQVPLLEGTYFISASCADSTGTTEYDHCQNWVRFDVHQQHLFEEGVVSIPSKWNMS
jgi:ABC-2 type transport system ATP-binding protein